MFRRTIQLLTILSIATVLFISTSFSALAAQIPTKSTPTTKKAVFSSQIHLASSKKSTSGIKPDGIVLGSLCEVNTYGYEVSSGVLGGSTTVSCDGSVVTIETQIKFEYCTASFPGSTFCLGDWQVKRYGLYCVTGPTAKQNCPPGGDDDYNTGKNALWAFVGSVCVEFPTGTVDCGEAGVQVWMN